MVVTSLFTVPPTGFEPASFWGLFLALTCGNTRESAEYTVQSVDSLTWVFSRAPDRKSVV